MSISIGIIDDHQPFTSSLKALLEATQLFEVTILAYGGTDFQQKIATVSVPPEVVLVDVNMTDLGGIKTVEWIRANYPAIKIAALSMSKDDGTVIRMLRAGCSAYFFKNIHHDELVRGIQEVKNKGYYNGDECNIKFRRLAINDSWYKESQPSEKEMIFLQHACSDFTYVQIAALMNCSKRTVDGYRESLFIKFKVQSRVGLCLEAIRRELVVI